MKKNLFLLAVLAFTPIIALAQSTGASNFVPLTAIPHLADVANSSSLAGLFNNLYRIAIGAAAIIAVLQIILAGIMYMSAGDNSERVGTARTKIGNSLMGLLLVLSPYIVFSIVNPNILSLQIGGIHQLESGSAPVTTSSITGTGTNTASTFNTGSGCTVTIPNGASITGTNDQNCCMAQKGCNVQTSLTNATNAPTCVCSSS